MKSCSDWFFLIFAHFEFATYFRQVGTGATKDWERFGCLARRDSNATHGGRQVEKQEASFNKTKMKSTKSGNKTGIQDCKNTGLENRNVAKPTKSEGKNRDSVTQRGWLTNRTQVSIKTWRMRMKSTKWKTWQQNAPKTPVWLINRWSWPSLKEASSNVSFTGDDGTQFTTSRASSGRNLGKHKLDMCSPVEAQTPAAVKPTSVSGTSRRRCETTFLLPQCGFMVKECGRLTKRGVQQTADCWATEVVHQARMGKNFTFKTSTISVLSSQTLTERC